MLCHYKHVLELNKKEFMQLVTCRYSENASYYPHDCEEDSENQAFYMFPDEDDADKNAKEEYNLVMYMLYKLIQNGIFVCELEALENKEVQYYTIVVK